LASIFPEIESGPSALGLLHSNAVTAAVPGYGRNSVIHKRHSRASIATDGSLPARGAAGPNPAYVLRQASDFRPAGAIRSNTSCAAPQATAAFSH
jgi:hypothetical protein